MILLVYLVILSAYFNIGVAMAIAFLLGILKNMWFGEVIGTASLMYVTVVFAIHLYKRKFNAKSLGFLFIASVVVIIIAEIIESRSISFSQTQITRALITSFIVVVLFKIVFTLWGPEEERKLPA